MAHRSGALGRRRLRSAISARMPITSPITSRASARGARRRSATFVPGAKLDDNVQIMLRYASGARGALWASQVAPGDENGLGSGSTATRPGSLAQDRSELTAGSPFGKPTAASSPARPEPGGAAARVTRVPPGHPEGYLEGFATSIRRLGSRSKRRARARKPPRGAHLPTVEDGMKGLAFVEAAVKSSKANGKWVKP